MNVIGSVLIVRADEVLERAIASDQGSFDDKDLTESFLNQMSVDYPSQRKGGKKTTITENMDEQDKGVVNDGQDFSPV